MLPPPSAQEILVAQDVLDTLAHSVYFSTTSSGRLCGEMSEYAGIQNEWSLSIATFVYSLSVINMSSGTYPSQHHEPMSVHSPSPEYTNSRE